MNIETSYKIENVITFADLKVGEVFSFDDCSGLYVVTSRREALDLNLERIEDFDADEKVIRRKIKIVIDDTLPVIID